MTDILEIEWEKLKAHGSTSKLPSDMSDEERIEFIKWNILACTDELHEALAEVGWKEWATSRHFNRDAFLHELIDAQLFLHNLMLAVVRDGESVSKLQDEVDSLIMARIHRAIERQRVGYDGVAGKCPHCHRSLDDVPTIITDGVRHCGGCGRNVDM